MPHEPQEPSPESVKEAGAMIESVTWLNSIDRWNAIALALDAAKRQAADEAYRRGLVEGRNEAAKVCRNEQKKYEANLVECDRAGNTTGGTNDAVGSLACSRCINAILTLPVEGGKV